MRASRNKFEGGMRPLLLRFLAIVALSYFPGTSYSTELLPSTQAEVKALLENLRTSECRFYRNRTWHDGAAAHDHLRRKFNYLVKRGLIARTEDFIAHAATRSSITGEPYQVQCPGRDPELSATWLVHELEHLRKTKKPPVSKP
jgi:hypothetical protein